MEGIFASEGITQSNRILHTASVFAKNNLLYVQEVGRLKSITPHICHRENLDSYLIFEVLRGSGTVSQNGEKIELHKGDCVWIDCHEAFEHLSSEEEPWELIWVHYNGKCAKEFYELFRKKNKTIVFSLADSDKVAGMIQKVFEQTRDNESELLVHSTLTQMVVECSVQNGEKDKIKEVREFVNANYKEGELFSVLMDRFHCSKETLENSFYEEYGIGLRDYILNRRFNAAKELLRFTILPMERVIEQSGICNEDLFYQLFRENENMSPEKYREKWAQWIKD